MSFSSAPARTSGKPTRRLRLPATSSTELSRLGRGFFGKLVVLALALVPTIYAGLLIWSNIDSTNTLDSVPAAVVNLDQPVDVVDANGAKQPVALGRYVAGQLTSSEASNNLHWKLADADTAQAGLEDGTYYAVLTIPQGFSKAATSTGAPETAQAASMRLETNDATSYLAGNIASAVSTKMTTATASGLTKTYLDRIYLGFNSMHTRMLEAADGAGELADGTTKLADGAVALDSGIGELGQGLAKLADGTGQLVTGGNELAAGAAKLSQGAGQVASGNAQLADGLKQAAEQTAALPQQSRQLADGAGKVSAGAAHLATGAGDLATGLKAASEQTAALPGQARALAEGSQQLLTAAGQLGASAGHLASGAQGVADGGARLADGATQLTSGASELASGTERLRAGARTAADSAGTLASGAGQLSNGLTQYTQGVSGLASQCAASGAAPQFCAQVSAVAGQGSQLAGSAQEVASGADQLAGGVGQLASSTGRLVEGAAALASGAAPLRAGADQLATGAQQLGAGAAQFSAGATQLTSGGNALGDGLNQLADGTPQLVTGIAAAADGAAQLQAGATELATGAGQLDGGLTQLAAGAPKLAQGIAQASSAAQQLATGAGELGTGAQSLAAGAGQLADGVTQLDTGAKAAADGSARLASGAGELRTGAGKLDDGAHELAKGLASGAKQIPHYDSAQRDTLATVVAEPVGTDGVRLHRVANYGSGLAPYFVGLGLWVGGMALFFMLRPLSQRAIASTAPSWKVALAGYAPGALFGVLQALVLFAVLRWGLDIDIAQPGLFVAFAILASLTFVAINHALVASLGPAGRFIGLLLTVLQLAAAGATYPIETSPGLFQWLHPLLPLTYAVRAFRSLIAGGSLHLGSSAAVLAAWLIAALLITTLAARSQRTWSVARLRPARAL